MRITQSQLESYLWGAAVLLRGTIDAGDYKQFIFPLLFYKRLCDAFDEETQIALAESGGDKEFAAFPENHRSQIPPEAHWQEVRQAARDVGRALQSAFRAIETANPDKLYGIFGDAQWTNKDRLTDAMLHDLIEHFSSLELTIANLPEDELGQGYEYLIKKFADDSGHTAAEFYTNRTVVHLMTEMLQPQPVESIYDPTCGSGGMLLSCITQLRRQGKEWRNVRLYGQERNLMTSSIARMNCFLHGIEDFRIERGDTLSEPKFVQGDRLMQFDVVLANPPYSIKQWDRAAFASDPWGRNLYGTPPQGRADYAFWQHIICSLAPKTGRCAILFPHGVLFRQEEAEMRRKFIEADLIECVLGLGPNLFYNSPMEACVVICRTDKPKERRGKILFINAVSEVIREHAQSFLTDENIERIVLAYEKFKDEPDFTRVATVDEIRKQNWSINIQLYAANTEHRRTEIRSSGGSLEETFEAWLGEVKTVRESLSTVLGKGVVSETLPDARMANIKLPAWLDRSKWQRFRFDQIAENVRDTGQPTPEDSATYVGLEHLDSGSLHVRRWGSDADLKGQKLRMQKGDILFAKRNAYLRRVAIAPHDGFFSAHGMILRAKPNVILPEFLPFLMMSDRFMNRAVEISVGSLSPTINWSTLKLQEFDLPPLDQQRSIAEMLWAVDTYLVNMLAMAQIAAMAKKSLLSEVLPQNGMFGKNATQCISLQDLCGEPITYGIVQAGPDTPGGIPYIRVTDMTNGSLKLEGMLRTTPEIATRFKRSTVRAGEIVCALRGPVGLLKVVPNELEGANLTQGTARISLKNNTLTRYILWAFESPFVKKQITDHVKGSTFKEITLSALRKIEIPLLADKIQMSFEQQLEALEDFHFCAISSSEVARNLRTKLINSIIP